MNEQRRTFGDGLSMIFCGVLLILLSAAVSFIWIQYRQTQRLSREVEQLQNTLQFTLDRNEALTQLRDIVEQQRAYRDGLDADARGQSRRQEVDARLIEMEQAIREREIELNAEIRRSLE
jgi:hypothetical protein